MRKIVIILMLAASAGAMAQGRFCYSFEDYQAGRWTELQQLRPEAHSKSRQLWLGGNDYSFSTGSKATDKVLKKEAFAVEYHDTLYVNLRTLRYERHRFGDGYAQGLPYDGDKIMFVTYLIGKDVSRNLFVGGLILGVIGEAIAGADALDDRVCYLIDNGGNGKKIDIKLIGDRLIREMLAEDNIDEYQRYMSVHDIKERQSAAHVFPLLKEWGLVK